MTVDGARGVVRRRRSQLKANTLKSSGGSPALAVRQIRTDENVLIHSNDVSIRIETKRCANFDQKSPQRRGQVASSRTISPRARSVALPKSARERAAASVSGMAKNFAASSSRVSVG